MLTEPTKMPENLENLSIPELEALLFSDFVNTKDSPNTDFITKVMEVIVKKEQESTCYEPINIDQACSDFQEFYLENQLDMPSATVHIQKKSFRSIRRLICIAAVVAVIIAMATILVMGYRSVFHMIGTWTSEQFHFIPTNESSKSFTENINSVNSIDSKHASSIHDALIKYGVNIQLLPTDIPNGFEQTELNIIESPSGNIRLRSSYKNGDHSITFNVTIYAKTSSALYEKNAESVEVLSVAGLTYYVFSNTNSEIAAVTYDNMEASIHTTLPRHDLLDMLNSLND